MNTLYKGKRGPKKISELPLGFEPEILWYKAVTLANMETRSPVHEYNFHKFIFI